MLKCVSKDRTSHGGFQWPERGHVVCPDWNPVAECGNGLHGWPWGLAVGDGEEPEYSSAWLVLSVDPKNIVGLGDKAKCSECDVIECGTYLECYMRVIVGQIAWTQHAASGAASATGWSGAASATGAKGAASATGEKGAASATGWMSSLECSSTGICATTADVVVWVIRAGAVLCQRTSKGAWLLFADEWDVADGDRVLVEHGVIWVDWQ